MAYRDTQEAADFIASGDSRETSPEIMRAIAFFARNTAEAERLWNGDGFGEICHTTDFWEAVTHNGLYETVEFCWGAAGRAWWSAIGGED